MTSLTVHTIFEAATILSLLAEPEFAGNYDLLAARDVKPRSDHFLAVFVFSAEPLEDGSRVLRIVSTTVAGIQRYTTTRLQYQGFHIVNPAGDSLLMDTLRAHYRARQEDTLERLMSLGGTLPLRWTKKFPNGAGDLACPPEFVIADPDLVELENLFSKPDPRTEAEGYD